MRSSFSSPNLMQRKRTSRLRDLLLFCRAVPQTPKRRRIRSCPLPVN